MFKKSTISAILIIIAATFIFICSFKDNLARPAAGLPKIINSHGLAIQYFVNGPEDGETLVLQASYARSGSDFNELVFRLNDAGYRTLVMQARGIEGTELPSMRPTLFDYADDLAAVIDAEGLRQPLTLIGHAFGNRILRAYASRYPERVRSLILLAAGDGAPPPEIRNAIFRILLRTLPQSVRSDALHLAFFAPGNSAPDYWLRGWYPKAGLAQGQATATTSAEEWTHGGGAKMFIIQPQFDAAAPNGADKLLQLYPERVTVELLPQAGHAILPEQPDTVSELILDYLSRR